MNLTSVSQRPGLQFNMLKSVKRDDPTPTPAPPAPPDPPPSIDFSVVDTPKKAAMLPILNAAAMLVNAQIMMQAVQGGFAVSSALTMKMGDNTQAAITHTLDPQTPAVNGQGNMGSAPFQETWNLSGDGAAINVAGSVGSSAEAIAFTIADDGAHLDGKIGDLELHQTISQQGDGDDAKLVFDGTLGDQKLRQELSIAQADPNSPPTINVVGKLGDDDIAFSETITDAQDTSLTLAGQGNIAGTPLSVTHTLAIVDGGDPNPPDPDPNPPDPDPNPAPAPDPGPPSKGHK